MNRRVLVCVLILLTGVTSARCGDLKRSTLMSATLHRPMPYTVYLPDGYDGGAQRYPVLYLLHGAGGDETSWAEKGDIKAKTDALITRGAIPATIIVMPGCPASWWVDGAKDKAETAFWTELVPTVAERYRTIETKAGRLIAGFSAGGYGAVRFAMRYPDRVAAVAALSPAVYADAPPAISAARTQPPFLGADGHFNQSAWDALNYPRLVDSYLSQPQRVPFYLASGDHDHFGIASETAALFGRLSSKQPNLVEIHVSDGDHNWNFWAPAVDGALRYIYKFAAKPQPALRTAQVQGPINSSSR